MNCIFYNFDVTWARNKPLLFQVSDLGITYFQSITYQQLATNCLKTIFPWLHLYLLAPSAAKFILIDTWYAHKWKIWRCLVIHHRTSFFEKSPKIDFFFFFGLYVWVLKWLQDSNLLEDWDFFWWKITIVKIRMHLNCWYWLFH